MTKKKLPVLSTTLYVLAGLLLLYAIWAAISSFGYISRMVAQNQLVISGNLFEIANFHMSSFGQYAFFAVILFTLGRIMQIKSSRPVDTREEVSSRKGADDDTDEDGFDDWFENNDK